MDIVYKNYKAYAERGRFNLYKEKRQKAMQDTKNHKKGDIIKTEISIGFGLRFESVIENIIKDKLADKKIVVTVKEYLEQYKKMKNEILDSLKEYDYPV